MNRILLTLCLLVSIAYGQTGMINYDTVISGRNFKVTMPDDWWSRSDSTEGIFWMHGLGEVGTDASNLNLYGPHYWINTVGSWDGKITMGNGVHRPVIISFQRVAGDASGNIRPFNLKPIIDMARARWRIKARAIYSIGFSQGGWVENLGVTYKGATDDFSYYTLFKAIVTIQGVVPTDTYGSTIASPQRFGNVAGYTNMYEPRPFKMLGFEQIGDSRNMHLYNKNMNDSVPGTGKFLWTNFGGTGHGEGVTNITDPASTNWTSSNTETQLNKSGNSYASTYIEANTNIYQWLLRQGDTTLSGVNTSPTANAGPDQSTSGTSITFAGSGSDADGTITSHTWTRVSGPNTPTITTASSYTSTVTGLVTGVYVFRLTVTDDDSTTGTDDMTVTVDPGTPSIRYTRRVRFVVQ